ncbi:MAG TPA: hypothetical protein VGO68_07720 [Pyrinomonadaceae bacterium]|nr:hypothetical protein [Pyrinomonadaceae bacterium]
MNLKRVVENVYVVAVSVGLVLLLAHWFGGADADPLLAAQNSRIRFQTGGETATNYAGLTPSEIVLAETVLEKHRVADGKHTELLYVGNSQTLAIMDQAPGDMVSPQWLQILLARKNGLTQPANAAAPPINVNLGSLPNITAPELLVRLIAAGERSPRQADILVASAVLEEFRGLGIRDEMLEAASEEKVKARLHLLVEQNSDLATVHTSLRPLLTSDAPAAATLTTEASGHSYAKRVEAKLQQSIEKVPLFARREDLRVAVALGYHELRNHLLGITSSSQRPVPEASYRASLEMIELALRYAQSQHIKVVLYLAPMRPVEPNPNVPSDVARFRRDLPALCSRYGAKCLDYVDLVPENLWTNYPDDVAGTEGQRDFAHFTGAAHKLLAEKLLADIADQTGSVSQSK